MWGQGLTGSQVMLLTTGLPTVVLDVQITTSLPFISPQRAEREPFKLVSLDPSFNQMLKGDQPDCYEQLEGQT